MIRNPILKVLSVMRTCQVRFLLMGGQACVSYGASEFSRDTDLAVLAETKNIESLRAALDILKAKLIAVPPFSLEYLRKGHVVHFRCDAEEAQGMRIDIMSVMRGVAPFEDLWERRTTLELIPELSVDLLSLPDLVMAKKTQRDKDWPVIRRLVEADYQSRSTTQDDATVSFWIREARTPSLLRELHRRFPKQFAQGAAARPVLQRIPASSDDEIEFALLAEERAEREADRAYWAPLKKELETLRRLRVDSN